MVLINSLDLFVLLKGGVIQDSESLSVYVRDISYGDPFRLYEILHQIK